MEGAGDEQTTYALIGQPVLGSGRDFSWNTTSVPNGTYTLNGVAYDAAGSVGRSADVSTTVKN